MMEPAPGVLGSTTRLGMTSIYRPKHSVIVPEADVCQRAHASSADDSSERSPTDGQVDWVGRRKAQPANLVLPSTRRWMNSLPLEYRPQALPIRFPRIANLLAANWDNPEDCIAYISSLLHDQRGGRKGFPPEVLQDIHDLRVYYARLHPIIRFGSDTVTKR
jgi:hypothetical protein